MQQLTTNAGAWMPGHMTGAEPVKMRRRIGSTVYDISIHFSDTSKETMNDKILRLIRNEAVSGRAAGQ